MKNGTFVISVLLVSIGVSSCDKTNQNANRLEGEEWKVTSIEIGGEMVEESLLPEWHFDECDHDEELCYAHWELGDGDAEFVWQFNEQGESFTISNQSESDHDHDHDHADDDHDHGDEDHDDHDHGDFSAEPVDQCEELSGTYEVTSSKRSTMEFKSSSTIGHAGEEVIIQIEKED